MFIFERGIGLKFDVNVLCLRFIHKESFLFIVTYFRFSMLLVLEM